MAITKIEVPELFDFGSDNSAFKLPTGTTAERPTSPSNGEMRFNTTTGYVEYYDTTDAQWWEIDYASDPLTVDYLVVAGGGSASAAGGGAGGAGGLRTSYGSTSGGGGSAENTPTLVIGTSYNWSIGTGGAGVSHPSTGNKGNDSTFNGITSEGGGYGAGPSSSAAGGNGGSGGGGSCSSSVCFAGGNGTTGQGFDGGDRTGSLGGAVPSAGGGGAGGAALDVTGNCNTCATAGGVGLAVSILNATNSGTASVGQVSGGNTYYAGGGGGSVEDYGGSGGSGGAGGLGGGSAGAYGCPGTAPLAATPNTGGGGGAPGGCGGAYSNAGGSGVIILRYPSIYTATATGTQASGSPFTEGTNKVSVFTAGTGTVTFSL